MRIVCWQTILMKYYTLFVSKIKNGVAEIAICCSRDWRFKGWYSSIRDILGNPAASSKMRELVGAPCSGTKDQDQSTLI